MIQFYYFHSHNAPRRNIGTLLSLVRVKNIGLRVFFSHDSDSIRIKRFPAVVGSLGLVSWSADIRTWP